MATTRLMPLHVGKGRDVSTAIADIIDYVENPQKTDSGKFIYGYECDTRTAGAEFLLSKRQYANLTGRDRGADDVIAYHLRQAFKPGEVTPEEANRIGRELALKLTKGNHAFVVCTHVDKHHVHNHVIINSTTLDCQKKFRNFWGSTWAIRRMNDKLCLEHGLSIVENPKPSRDHYGTWMGSQKQPSHQERLRWATSDTKAMHDHNTVNYNGKYSFGNIECNQHLQRDCQKNSDNTCHKWSDSLKAHISATIKDRNDAIKRGETSFDGFYIEQFHKKVDEYLSEGWAENEADPNNYGASFERTLLSRIDKFRCNYFMWVEDFSLPTTNNLAERSLRGVKSHMKIFGQFESEAAADNHALIRTYIETCRRNGINEIDALERLCAGTPYSVAEIFSSSLPC